MGEIGVFDFCDLLLGEVSLLRLGSLGDFVGMLFIVELKKDVLFFGELEFCICLMNTILLLGDFIDDCGDDDFIDVTSLLTLTLGDDIFIDVGVLSSVVDDEKFRGLFLEGDCNNVFCLTFWILVLGDFCDPLPLESELVLDGLIPRLNLSGDLWNESKLFHMFTTRWFVLQRSPVWANFWIFHYQNYYLLYLYLVGFLLLQFLNLFGIILGKFNLNIGGLGGFPTFQIIKGFYMFH